MNTRTALALVLLAALNAVALLLLFFVMMRIAALLTDLRATNLFPSNPTRLAMSVNSGVGELLALKR
ncbi:MAG TPA: hypothetical protein VLT83_06230 [Opitutaceae bacterium]|nr:hypothetical protein [Opitutaceae bacterium]